MHTCLSSIFRRICRSKYNLCNTQSFALTGDQTTSPIFFYVKHDSPFLKQGEIINNLFELKLLIPQRITIDVNQGVQVEQSIHPYAIVVSQDCDIEQDYKARLHEVPEDKLLTHLLFCALFTQEEIRRRNNLKADQWKRIRQNQDERYHYLVEAPIHGTEDSLPELIADFKTTFSLRIEFVSWSVSTNQAVRKGGLLSPYLEDFMHRLYSFLGRVATPPMT